MIELIGEKGFTSFTILKKELKVSTGTIYHHLDTLSQLIEQKEDKKYYLTELGQHAYSSLQENISSISMETSRKEFDSPILKGLMYLTPRSLINSDQPLSLISVIFSTIILFGGVFFSYLNEFFPFFLLFSTFPEEFLLEGPEANLIGAILFIVNFIAYFAIIEGLIRVIYKKEENSIKFLSTFAFVFFPSNIYLILHYLFKIYNFLEYSFMGILDNLIMILMQAWSLWILTYSILIYKQLRIENSLILSLLLHYGGFSIILVIAI